LNDGRKKKYINIFGSFTEPLRFVAFTWPCEGHKSQYFSIILGRTKLITQ